MRHSTFMIKTVLATFLDPNVPQYIPSTIDLSPLCTANLLQSEMEKYYKFMPFKYDDILDLAYDINGPDFTGQHFFINHKSLQKIFNDRDTASFLKILSQKINNQLDESIKNMLTSGISDKIKQFITDYLADVIVSDENLTTHLTRGDIKLDNILNNMMNGKFCPEMATRLYMIAVFDNVSKLIPQSNSQSLTYKEVNSIILNEILSLWNIINDTKAVVSLDKFICLFNNMLKNRFKLLFEMIEKLASTQESLTPVEWSERMGMHFNYEARIASVQRMFRSHLQTFRPNRLKFGDTLLSVSLVVDSTKNNESTFFDKYDKMILNKDVLKDIASIEYSFHYKNVSFENGTDIEKFNARVTQNTGKRISLIKIYARKNYALNMIFFDPTSKNDNDIYLHDVRSEYVLNVLKVFTNFEFYTNYNGNLKCLTAWTLTDGYKSRLNENFLSSGFEYNKFVRISDIATNVLNGLEDLEKQNVFYDDLSIDDVVIDIDENNNKKYKLDLRRARRVDNYEIKRPRKSLNDYHDHTIDEFKKFFYDLISKSKLLPHHFRYFINKFADAKNNDKGLSEFKYLISILKGEDI